jgi:ferredoxin
MILAPEKRELLHEYAKNRAALEKSIKHWEKNVVAKTSVQASVSAGDCALCKLHRRQGACDQECPVKAKTGLDLCGGTPYDDAWRALVAWIDEEPNTDSWRKARALWRKAAQAELDFLISLRPEAAP